MVNAMTPTARQAADLEAIAERHGKPLWWVKAVAVEYLPCRRFAGASEVWEFDFSLLADADVEMAIQQHRVVVHGTIFHNVHSDVLRTRMRNRIFGNFAVPLTRRPDDGMPEGRVSDFHLPWLGNPIDTWDPKLDFSSHVQVVDEDGLWQWKVAHFEPVAGRGTGKWVSDLVDLEPLDEVASRLAELRNPPVLRRPGSAGYRAFRDSVEKFYEWVEEVRRPIRDALWDFHVERQSQGWRSTVVRGDPPLLSMLEDFTVENGEIMTSLHGAPIFYRACSESVARASKSEAEGTDRSRTLAERAQAIINAAACLEAYINGIGADTVPRWDLYEKKLTVEGKWQLCLSTAGHPLHYDPGREPFQAMGRIFVLRNRWMHYGRAFEKVSRPHGGAVTSIDAQMDAALIASLPAQLAELVRDMSLVVDQPPPAWLNIAAFWPD